MLQSATSQDPAAAKASRIGRMMTIVRVTSGHFLEMFDFILFGFYASSIGQAFFPTSSEYGTLLLTFATFGAGFLMRPIGSLFLGVYVDRIGRRKGLLITLGLMAAGTLLIAFTPGYATIGLAAPVLVLIGRLVQGLSAGRNSAMSLSTSPKSPRRAARASMSPGRRSGSRSASSWRVCSASRSTA